MFTFSLYDIVVPINLVIVSLHMNWLEHSRRNVPFLPPLKGNFTFLTLYQVLKNTSESKLVLVLSPPVQRQISCLTLGQAPAPLKDVKFYLV